MSRLEKFLILVVFSFFFLILGGTIYSFFKVNSYQAIADGPQENEEIEISKEQRQKNPDKLSKSEKSGKSGNSRKAGKSKNRPIAQQERKTFSFSPLSFSPEVRKSISGRHSELLEHKLEQQRNNFYQQLGAISAAADLQAAPTFTSQQNTFILLPTVAYVAKKWRNSFDHADIIQQNAQGLLVMVNKIPNQIPQHKVVLNQNNNSIGLLTGKIIVQLKEDGDIDEILHDFPDLTKVYEVPETKLYFFNTPESYDQFEAVQKMRQNQNILSAEFEIINHSLETK